MIEDFYNAVVIGNDGLRSLAPGEHVRIMRGPSDNIVVRRKDGSAYGLPLRGCSIQPVYHGMVWRVENRDLKKVLAFFTEDERLKEQMRSLHNTISRQDGGSWDEV